MRNKKEIKYPELLAEMGRRGESQKCLAVLLQLNQATISRKLSGESDWTITEIKKVCDYYNKDFYQLFK